SAVHGPAGIVDVLYYLQPEARNGVHLLRGTQHPHAADAEIPQDLRAGAEVAQNRFRRAGPAALWDRVVATHRTNRAHEITGRFAIAEQHDDTVVGFRDPAHRRTQRPTEAAAVYADHVAERILDMHPDERRLGRVQFPAHQCQMHVAAHVILVAEQTEIAEIRRHDGVGYALDRFLVLQPVADQIGDRAHLEPVGARENLELGPARHGAVVVQDLDDDGR